MTVIMEVLITVASQMSNLVLIFFSVGNSAPQGVETKDFPQMRRCGSPQRIEAFAQKNR